MRVLLLRLYLQHYEASVSYHPKGPTPPPLSLFGELRRRNQKMLMLIMHCNERLHPQSFSAPGPNTSAIAFLDPPLVVPK